MPNTVCKASVACRVGDIVGNNSEALVDTEHGVKCCTEECDLIDAGEIKKGFILGPELDGGISLINPDIDLAIEMPAGCEEPNEGGRAICQVAHADAVGTDDDHLYNVLNDVILQLTGRDVGLLVAAGPAEHVALDHCICRGILFRVRICCAEIRCHALDCLGIEELVVGGDHHVESEFILLEGCNKLLYLAGLPTLGWQNKALDLLAALLGSHL